MKRLIYLIGYRGTGKTTVGRLLAQRLGWDFVDADVILEQNAGKSIKQIFSEEGEASFREHEANNLRQLMTRDSCVVATGGGIILREENRRILKETGWVVWLTASVATIAARIAADPTTAERRPNLSVGGMAEIDELLRQRQPYYHQCADLELAADGRSPEALVESILTQWNSSNRSSAHPSG